MHLCYSQPKAVLEFKLKEEGLASNDHQAINKTIYYPVQRGTYAPSCVIGLYIAFT